MNKSLRQNCKRIHSKPMIEPGTSLQWLWQEDNPLKDRGMYTYYNVGGFFEEDNSMFFPFFCAVGLLLGHTDRQETKGRSNFDITKPVTVTDAPTNTGANTQASNSYECGRNDDSHTLKTRHKRET